MPKDLEDLIKTTLQDLPRGELEGAFACSYHDPIKNIFWRSHAKA